MARGIRTLALAGFGVAAAALAAAAPRAEVQLEIENTTRGRAVLRLPLGAGESFSVVYHHSMYDQPVTEEFKVEDGRIVLRAVESPSAAVREYLGITEAGARHAVRRVLGEIVFRVAAGTPQRLRVGGAERSFLELGEHGDRLVLRVRR
jgi:hypothetical protein